MKPSHTAPNLLLTVLLTLTVLGACGSSDDETASPTPVPEETEAPAQRTITIGNIADISGPASSGFTTLYLGLEDLARYYSEEDIIPGVRFEVETYDTRYDPAKEAAAYEHLVGEGADVLFTAIASAPVSLKSRLDADGMVLCTVVPVPEAFEPPGRVFAIGCNAYNYLAYTLLDWIAENDPDFPAGRPARIGGAMYAEALGESLMRGATDYVRSHPEQYEWVGGFLEGIKFSWADEVEALKECDYIFIPPIMPTFGQQFRAAGGTAKFLGTDAHLTFLGQIDDAGLWNEFDGSLFVQTGIWWTDEGEIVELAKDMLNRYHPQQAAEIRRTGVGYITIYNFEVMFETIGRAVAAVGADRFDSRAFYDAAVSFSATINGHANTFSDTKRTSSDQAAVYELRSADEDVFKAHHGQLPILYQP